MKFKVPGAGIMDYKSIIHYTKKVLTVEGEEIPLNEVKLNERVRVTFQSSAGTNDEIIQRIE